MELHLNLQARIRSHGADTVGVDLHELLALLKASLEVQNLEGI
jgi:hypothetical protein